MKKVTVVTLAVAVGLALIGGVAFAGMGYGPGGGYGYGPCAYGAGPGAWTQADANKVRAFQKETLPLRDEVMAKRIELRNEFAKEKPDQAKIAALQKDLIDLHAQIRTSAEKNGLPTAYGYGRGYAGRGQGWGGRGGMGRGYGYGNCPRW